MSNPTSTINKEPTYEDLVVRCKQLEERNNALELQLSDTNGFADLDPNPVFRFSKNGRVLMYANQAGKDIIKYLDDPNNLKKKLDWYGQLQKTFESGEESSIELDMGSEVFQGSLVLPEDRNYINVYAADVSAIKRARQSVVASEDKYRGILETMELGLLELDSKGVIQRAYPYLCRSLGYTPEELVGQNANRILMPTEWASYMRDKRLRRQMGQTEVLEVQMKKKCGQLVWMLISSAPIHNEYNELTDFIEIKDFAADISAPMSDADVCLVPSLVKDSFPTTVIEAMSAGKPVITTNNGGAKEAVVDGQTGYLIDPMDTEKLADRIIRLLVNQDKLSEMGKAGKKRYRMLYTAEVFARNWMEFMDESFPSSIETRMPRIAPQMPDLAAA